MDYRIKLYQHRIHLNQRPIVADNTTLHWNENAYNTIQSNPKE